MKKVNSSCKWEHFLEDGKIDGEAYKTVICSVHNPTIIVKDLPSEPHRITIKPLFSEDTPDKFEIIAVFSRDGEKATISKNYNVF